MRLTAVCLCILIASLAMARLVPAQDERKGGTPKEAEGEAEIFVRASAESEPTATEALGWLAGTWRAGETGDLWEETWSAPEGDGLVGMTRWVKDGKVVMYELMTIVDGTDGQHLRMRHFNRGLVPWPSEKDGAMKHKAVRVAKDLVVFEAPEGGWPQRISYRRDGDDLVVVLGGMGEDAAKTESFPFKRMR